MKNLLLTAAAMLLTTTAAQAADVVVKDVHICCGACVKALNKTLPDAAVDKGAKTVSFSADSEKAAKAGLAKLLKAGFGGKATIDGEKVDLPAPKKGTKADAVTFQGVHLCCGGCAKAVGKALADFGDVSCDRKAKTCTVKGKGIDVAKAHAALVGAGFYGKVAKK